MVAISLRYAKADNRTNKCKPITEIVLIDATQIATLKHQREFINSIEAHRFNWGFSGKSPPRDDSGKTHKDTSQPVTVG
jgi:hypothetical protein